jgi:hypothetical protein
MEASPRSKVSFLGVKKETHIVPVADSVIAGCRNEHGSSAAPLHIMQHPVWATTPDGIAQPSRAARQSGAEQCVTECSRRTWLTAQGQVEAAVTIEQHRQDDSDCRIIKCLVQMGNRPCFEH